MQHANSMGLKRERYQTWDYVLAKFNMPALEKLYAISSKAKAVKLFLIFITNGRRISRSWPKIENSPKHKNTGESEYTIKNAQTYQVPLPPRWTLHPTYPNSRRHPHMGPLHLPCRRPLHSGSHQFWDRQSLYRPWERLQNSCHQFHW